MIETQATGLGCALSRPTAKYTTPVHGYVQNIECDESRDEEVQTKPFPPNAKAN